MKTKEQITKMLEEIEADTRLEQPAAHVEVNGPLAIIQIELKTRAGAFRDILGLPRRMYHGEDSAG